MEATAAEADQLRSEAAALKEASAHLITLSTNY
jgi:hypothetical protein